MYLEFTFNKKGEKENAVSMYNPDKETRDVTHYVLKDYLHGKKLQDTPRREFNDRSLKTEIDGNYRAFNSYVPPKSEDPDEVWRAQTVRPLTRNKIISIASHVTQAVLYPNVFARNEDDEEDKLVAQVMKDLVDYTIDNSNYERAFIQAAISMLVEPCVIVESKFYEVYRDVKMQKGKDGKYEKKKILDEVMSGFMTSVVPSAELLIANFYEPDIQKQRFVIRNRYIDYSEAASLYGDHKNWAYVRPGAMNVFDSENDMFYEVYDENASEYLVNEVIYENRAKDCRLVFVNGVLVTDPEQPNPRKDKLYGYAKSIFEPINNGQFFYGKPAVTKLASDQEVVDTLYNMLLDGTFMQLMPSIAVYGHEGADASVLIPGTVTSFRDPNTKIDTLAPRTDIRAGLEAISLVERSMSESSQDSSQMGLAGGQEITARQAIILQQNARTALGLFGKQISFLVHDIGTLRVGEICQYMTVGVANEVASEIKYKAYTVLNRTENGNSVNRKIEFVDDFYNMEGKSNADELKQMSFDILDEEMRKNKDMRIYKINPEKFRNMKYSITINVDELTPKSQALQKALDLEGYDRMIQNPYVDQEKVTRDFLLNALRPGSGDKYMKKGQSTEGAYGGGAFQQKGVDTSMLSQMTGSNSLGVAASTDLGGTAQGTMDGMEVNTGELQY